MAPIYDFPRAARAEHGHGAKKVLAGVRFQWTDTQNDNNNNAIRSHLATLSARLARA